MVFEVVLLSECSNDRIAIKRLLEVAEDRGHRHRLYPITICIGSHCIEEEVYRDYQVDGNDC